MISLLFLLYFVGVNTETRDLVLTVPSVRPTKEDQYICHGLDLKDETLYIIGFKPHANASHAHHILIYSCAEPGSTMPTWNCEEMKITEAKPVCKSESKLIFSWAMNAQGFKLPKDVSIMIGKSIGKSFLVIQNHYKNVDYFKKPGSEGDQSGIILNVQTEPTKKLAGLYKLVTDGSIPAHSTIYMEAACSYNGKIALHPFAFRTHTHKLGKLVSGYVIHKKQWKEIGKKSPQVEQMFYPVEGDVTIQPGDVIAARCIMENSGDKLVKIGPTQKDEMCNFYIYYWVDRADSSQIYDEANQLCFTPGWPDFKWDKVMDNLKIPDDAAILPGENNIIKEMVSSMKNDEKEMDNLMSEMFEGNSEEDDINDASNDLLPSNDKFGNFQDEHGLF